jgi:hypothetical protein
MKVVIKPNLIRIKVFWEPVIQSDGPNKAKARHGMGPNSQAAR